MGFNKKNSEIEEPRVNHEIKGHTEVRLIYKEHKDMPSENDFNKIVPWKEAVNIANSMELDLIEINGNITPAIIRLGDYSKYLYELKKQLKQKRKKTSDLKEIQLSVNISRHDLDIKLKKAKEFIADGDKVKLVLTMKGRELVRREESKKSFLLFVEDMLESGIASLDGPIRDEEKKVLVIFKKK